MKNRAIIILISVWVFLGLCGDAFAARGVSPGGGLPSGRPGGPPGGGGPPPGGGYHGGGGYYHGGGRYYYGGGSGVYFGFGFPFYGYPYYYPYGYPYYYPYGYTYSLYPSYPYVYDQPTVYVESEQPYSWYYCPEANAYYPYVTTCPGGWTEVTPTPPGKEGVTR